MVPDSQNDASSVTTCPCQEFGTVQAIRSALDSEERTLALVTWLSDHTKTDHGRRVSCQPRENLRCVRRVSVSFSILNGIRDACRPFLEPVATKQGAAETLPTYEASFPALPSSSSSVEPMVAPKKPKKKIVLTDKSRIRSEFAWGNNAQGNISTLPSTEPIRTTDDWPAMSTSNNSTLEKGTTEKAKRRICPTPVSAWRPAARGNMSTLSSTDPVSIQKMADFRKVTQSSEWPVKMASDGNHNSTKIFQHAAIKSMPLSDQHNNSKQSGTMSSQDNSTCDRTMERHNLARIYSELIRCHLVPSSALELHLMVRLLTAKDDDTAISTDLDGKGSIVFGALFASASHCRSFAVDVLTRVTYILRNLHLDIIVGFTMCPPFAELLPHVTKELRAIVEHRRETLLSEVDVVSIAGSTQIPLLTLPFDHDRDSRHNYKSREEVAIYKNREESRDAFLYQLRAFQNVRGKVLDAVQAERSIDRIRAASKNVIHGLLKTNMPWFTQMFCDLLVQIGLVPMEETDKELLNITDKDKLQVSPFLSMSTNGQYIRTHSSCDDLCFAVRNFTYDSLQKALKQERAARISYSIHRKI